MQRNGGGRDPFSGFGDPFAGFGGFSGFSGHRSLMSNFFGGRDPFDDPFFTRPFGGMFESAHFGHPGNPFTDAHASGLLEHQAPQLNRPRGPIIEELNSDDEKGQQEKKDNPRKHSRSSNEPYVEYPDDEAGGKHVSNSVSARHFYCLQFKGIDIILLQGGGVSKFSTGMISAGQAIRICNPKPIASAFRAPVLLMVAQMEHITPHLELGGQGVTGLVF